MRQMYAILVLRGGADPISQRFHINGKIYCRNVDSSFHFPSLSGLVSFCQLVFGWICGCLCVSMLDGKTVFMMTFYVDIWGGVWGGVWVTKKNFYPTAMRRGRWCSCYFSVCTEEGYFSGRKRKTEPKYVFARAKRAHVRQQSKWNNIPFIPADYALGVCECLSIWEFTNFPNQIRMKFCSRNKFIFYEEIYQFLLWKQQNVLEGALLRHPKTIPINCTKLLAVAVDLGICLWILCMSSLP